MKGSVTRLQFTREYIGLGDVRAPLGIKRKVGSGGKTFIAHVSQTSKMIELRFLLVDQNDQICTCMCKQEKKRHSSSVLKFLPSKNEWHGKNWWQVDRGKLQVWIYVWKKKSHPSRKDRWTCFPRSECEYTSCLSSSLWYTTVWQMTHTHAGHLIPRIRALFQGVETAASWLEGGKLAEQRYGCCWTHFT